MAQNSKTMPEKLRVVFPAFFVTWKRMEVSELGGLSWSDGGDIWAFLSFCMC